MRSIIPRELIKHLEWTPGQEPPQSPEGNGGEPTGSNIESSDDFWSISGVQYRNGIHTVDLSKALLDSGATKTQPDWAQFSESAISTNGFYTPDYPLLYGLIKTLYLGRDDATKSAQIAEAQAFLKDTSRARWLMTLTRLQYQPNGDDTIIHNFGTKDRYEELSDFVGPDEWVKNTGNIEPYQKLLGTNDTKTQINDVFHWLNGTDAYLWRVNARPQTLDERVAGFCANSDRAGLIADRNPTYAYSSLGVRAVRRASP